MNSAQPNKENQLHPQQNNLPSEGTSQQSHFVHAKEIIKTWPEWKRNVCFAATASNDNSNTSSDKK